MSIKPLVWFTTMAKIGQLANISYKQAKNWAYKKNNYLWNKANLKNNTIFSLSFNY